MITWTPTYRILFDNNNDDDLQCILEEYESLRVKLEKLEKEIVNHPSVQGKPMEVISYSTVNLNY